MYFDLYEQFWHLFTWKQIFWLETAIAFRSHWLKFYLVYNEFKLNQKLNVRYMVYNSQKQFQKFLFTKFTKGLKMFMIPILFFIIYGEIFFNILRRNFSKQVSYDW